MTFVKLKSRILGFSSNRANLDNVPMLLEKANISLKQICRDTIPPFLVKDASSNRRIFRRLDEKSYICVPSTINDNDTEEIELDENLIDALALHILSGIETARAPSYMKMYWGIIANNENSLIEDDLAMYSVEPEDLINDIPQYIQNRDEVIDGDL